MPPESRPDLVAENRRVDPPPAEGTLRILLLAPFPPRTDGEHGGARAVSGLIAALARTHSVGLLYLRASDEPTVGEAVRECCELVVEVARDEARTGVTGRSAQKLRNLAGVLRGTPIWASKWSSRALGGEARRAIRQWQPDIVQLEFEVMARFLDELGAAAPVVLTVHDPGYASARDARRTGRPSIIRFLDARAWHRFERRVLEHVDAAVVFTDRDASELKSVATGARVTQIGLGYSVPSDAASPTGDGSHSILFVGNYVHPPNRDAAQWLVEAIFPGVRARVPDARLLLVGGGPAPVDQQADGVILAGRVPDVRPYLEAAAVVVAPIRSGGGMRVKVLEALAAGKAVVATPRAAEGLSVTPGRELLLVESERELVDGVVQLLEDPAARVALGRAARAWAEEHLDWGLSADAYGRLYRDLLQARTHVRMHAQTQTRD